MGAAGDLAAGVEALERRLRVGVDDEPAVLVVEDGVGEDRLAQRVDPARTVPAKHVRQGDVRVAFRYPRGVEVDGGSPVCRLHALAGRDLVDDRLRYRVARPQRI